MASLLKRNAPLQPSLSAPAKKRQCGSIHDNEPAPAAAPLPDLVPGLATAVQRLFDRFTDADTSLQRMPAGVLAYMLDPTSDCHHLLLSSGTAAVFALAVIDQTAACVTITTLHQDHDEAATAVFRTALEDPVLPFSAPGPDFQIHHEHLGVDYSHIHPRSVSDATNPHLLGPLDAIGAAAVTLAAVAIKKLTRSDINIDCHWNPLAWYLTLHSQNASVSDSMIQAVLDHYCSTFSISPLSETSNVVAVATWLSTVLPPWRQSCRSRLEILQKWAQEQNAIYQLTKAYRPVLAQNQAERAARLANRKLEAKIAALEGSLEAFRDEPDAEEYRRYAADLQRFKEELSASEQRIDVDDAMRRVSESFSYFVNMLASLCLDVDELYAQEEAKFTGDQAVLASAIKL